MAKFSRPFLIIRRMAKLKATVRIDTQKILENLMDNLMNIFEVSLTVDFQIARSKRLFYRDSMCAALQTCTLSNQGKCFVQKMWNTKNLWSRHMVWNSRQ